MPELSAHDIALLIERVNFDLSYKRDQRELLQSALAKTESQLAICVGNLSSTRHLQKISDRLYRQISALNLEIRALEVQKRNLEKAAYEAGATYADLSPQWRAAADRTRK